MDVADEVAGEFLISLGGALHVMRPSYDAVIAFEEDTGKAALELARAAASGALGTQHAAAVVTRCVQAWGESAGKGASATQQAASQVNASRIGKLLLEEGMLQVNQKLKQLLYLVVTGGVTSTGEAKVRPTPATTEEPQSDAA